MTRHRLLVALFSLSAAAITAIPAAAQQPAGTAASTSSVRVTFVVKPVLSIAVDPESIEFGDVALDTGTSFRSPVPLSIRVRANTPWTLAASVEPGIRTARSRADASGAAAPAPSVRLENLLPGKTAAVKLSPLRTQGISSALISGGSTDPNGLVLRPDLTVDIPPGTSGSYRLRIVLDLRGAP